MILDARHLKDVFAVHHPSEKTDYMIYIMNSIQIALQLLAVYKH